MDISERIKKRRLELNLTLEDVADKLGVAKSTVSRYETNDIVNMGIDKLELIASALRTTPAYLMGWEIEHDGINFTAEHDGNKYYGKFRDTIEELDEQELIETIKYAKYLISEREKK